MFELYEIQLYRSSRNVNKVFKILKNNLAKAAVDLMNWTRNMAVLGRSVLSVMAARHHEQERSQ